MNGKPVLLLGFGMQGKVAFYDLARSDLVSRLTVVDLDLDAEALKDMIARFELPGGKVQGVSLDAKDAAGVSALMRQADVVVDLLPARFAFQMAELAVENGVSFVSSQYLRDPGESDPARIARREEELLELDRRARDGALTVLPEFGMDPGVDLVLARQAVRELDEVREFYSYGAGLPEPRAADNVLKYKFMWSVEGLLRSYRRPARILRHGQVVDIPVTEVFSQDNMHILELPELGGPLESYPNGDAVKYAKLFGIETTVRSMGRYTCRYPGHGAFWDKVLKCGLLDETPVSVGGMSRAGRTGVVAVKPLDFMIALLGPQPQFHFGPQERDVALIRVDVRGIKDGKARRVIYQLIDVRDLSTGFTAMTRAVGFPVSIGAQMILRGDIAEKGLVLPADVPYGIFAEELRSRGLAAEHTVL